MVFINYTTDFYTNIFNTQIYYLNNYLAAILLAGVWKVVPLTSVN